MGSSCEAHLARGQFSDLKTLQLWPPFPLLLKGESFFHKSTQRQGVQTFERIPQVGISTWGKMNVGCAVVPLFLNTMTVNVTPFFQG